MRRKWDDLPISQDPELRFQLGCVVFVAALLLAMVAIGGTL